MLNAVSDDFATGLRGALPGDVFSRGGVAYGEDFFRRVKGRGDNLVLAPASTKEVVTIVRACAAARIAIVPQGGATGLVGGHIAPDLPPHVVLTLERMNAIRSVSPEANTMVAEAGVILQTAHETAEQVDRLFPLSIASQGSARIGGILATNAGGVNVLRYGNARDLCLGVEAVLADGSVLRGLSGLRKDNTGYDLRHLLLGSEGTLGIITAAVLKLHPRPHSTGAAMVAVRDPDAALKLLSLASERIGSQLSAFELISGASIDLCVRAGFDVRLPFSQTPRWIVLIDVGGDARATPPELLEDLMAAAMEGGLVGDGAIGQSEQQRREFWAFRERIPQANRHARALSNHDISLPLATLPDFIRAADAAVAALGDYRVNCVGHLGDGNLHYNVFAPDNRDPSGSLAIAADLRAAVNDLVISFGGSISAEHGIGRTKAADFARYVDPTKQRVIEAIKAALDPLGILNPGVMGLKG